MQVIQPIYYARATGSINTLHLKEQQKQTISRSWWLFLCARTTRLETRYGVWLFVHKMKDSLQSVLPQNVFLEISVS